MGARALSAQPGELPPLVQGRSVPVLSLSLEEFSQVFSSTRDSVGWVRIRATLVDPAPRGDVLLAQQVFEVRQPAGAANAAGGAQALSQAVDAVGGAAAAMAAASRARQTLANTPHARFRSPALSGLFCVGQNTGVRQCLVLGGL